MTCHCLFLIFSFDDSAGLSLVTVATLYIVFSLSQCSFCTSIRCLRFWVILLTYGLKSHNPLLTKPCRQGTFARNGLLFIRETTFVTCLLSCIPVPFLKEVSSKRNEFAPSGSKFFSFRGDPFSEGRHNNRIVYREKAPIEILFNVMSALKVNPLCYNLL